MKTCSAKDLDLEFFSISLNKADAQLIPTDTCSQPAKHPSGPRTLTKIMPKSKGDVSPRTDEQVLIDQKIAEEKCQILELKKSILQHRERIRELKYQRNMHSATMRLPPEILHTIFQHLQDLYRAQGGKERDRTDQWRRVLRVCRHWHSLAINSPSIWTTINIGDYRRTSRWPNLVLERSGTAMLDVRLMLSKYHKIFDEGVIFQNIARIRSLKIDIDGPMYNGGDTVLWNKFQGSLGSSNNDDAKVQGNAAVLKRLSVSLISESASTLSSAWFTIAPHLQHLKLTGINLDWTNFHFRDLRTLYVTDIPALAQPTLAMLQAAFAHMPSLEDLHLSDVLPVENETLPPIPSMTCNLPKLRELHIVSASSSSIAMFLSSTSFPSLDRFHIDVPPQKSNTIDHSYFFQALSTLRQHPYPTISMQYVYQFGDVKQIAFGMYLDEGIEGSQISLPGAVYNLRGMNLQTVTNFCTVTNFSCLKRLVVGDVPLQALKSNFGALPHLTSIVTLGDKSFTELIEALMIPPECSQHTQLTFPALESISARNLARYFTDEDDDEWGTLQDCLMQRYEYGAPVGELELLFISDMPPPDCVVELSEIVPRVTMVKTGRLCISDN